MVHHELRFRLHRVLFCVRHFGTNASLASPRASSVLNPVKKLPGRGRSPPSDLAASRYPGGRYPPYRTALVSQPQRAEHDRKPTVHGTVSMQCLPSYLYMRRPQRTGHTALQLQLTHMLRQKTTLRIAVVVYFPSYILLEKPTLVNRNTSRRVKLCTSNTRLTELY